MSDEYVYGVDTTKEITPIMVRDAIVRCFIEAHKDSLGIEEQDSDIIKRMVTEAVKKSFRETDGDFENPTKESLLRSIGNLKEFSKSFRNQEVIENHFNAIKSLIDKIE